MIAGLHYMRMEEGLVCVPEGQSCTYLVIKKIIGKE